MRDLTAYAPIRVALTGIWRIVFGLLLAVPAGALIWIGPKGEPGAPRAAGDLGPLWMYFVGLVLAVTALGFVTGGLGRIVCAFMKECYFQAGPGGIAIRIPKQGWFGRFKLIEYLFKWEEIEQLIYFTRSMNLIPVARELHIRLYGGKEITIERFYFKAPIKRLQGELQEIRAVASK